MASTRTTVTTSPAGDRARISLALLRLLFGSLALLVPRRLIRRIEGPEANSPAAIYAFRMFGIRTVLLGRQLLVTDGNDLAKALAEAPIIHGTDTATATLLTVTGQVPRRTGAMLMAVSGANTALSLLARGAPERRRTRRRR